MMRLILTASLAMTTASVQAQSTLDKFLKKGTEGSGSSASEAGINKVYNSALGYWRLDDDRAAGGACAITYVTPAYYFAYIAPLNATTKPFIVFNGPTIPPAQKETKKKVVLSTAYGSVQTVLATHAPDATYKEFGTIFMVLGSIEQAMETMNDVENLTIVMDKRQVFAMKWQGGHIARAAMQKCLGGAEQKGGMKK